MKNLSILMVTLLIVNGAMAQSCLPHGITFSTQVQIDNFQTNYPNCTQIQGDVTISGSDITNLNGLSALTSFGGDLTIEDCYALTSLTGLDSVSSIAGSLEITDCKNLTSLAGLDNLTSIGRLVIYYCDALTSLTALGNVTSIGISLIIFGCNGLTSLTGLESVTSIGGNIDISYCSAMTSLTGLDNLISAGSLEINDCNTLTSLTGLNSLTSIGGGLTIESCGSLTSLAGLERMTTIGMEFYIAYCSALTSLTGLDKLTSIGSSIYIHHCNGLTNLRGLDNLLFAGGLIYITYCNALATLSGLDNIDAVTIGKLEISNNHSLSLCKIKSICSYLLIPDATTEIHDNATGCTSQQEVEKSCHAIGMESLTPEPLLNLHPNPVNAFMTIETSHQGHLYISNLNGHELFQYEINESTTPIDISTLPIGVYVVKFIEKNGVQIGKIIKQ